MGIKEELQQVEHQLSSLWEELQHWSQDQGQHLRLEEGEVGSELALALHVEAYNLRRQELAQLRQKQLELKAQLAESGESEKDASQMELIEDQRTPIVFSNPHTPDLSDATYFQRQAKASALAQKYYVQRQGTNCRKWDGLESAYGYDNLLPMWVADMDFAIAQPIQKAIMDKIQNAAMGYSLMSDAYYEAVIQWYSQHFDYRPEKDWFFHAPGAMTAVHWALEALVAKNEGILVFSPLYPPLYHAAQILGRPFFDEPMTMTVNEDGSVIFGINWQSLEEKLSANRIKCVLLCSPQNPVGRVWTAAELSRLGELAEKHDLLLLVDEMHQDLVAEGYVQQAALALEGGRFAQRVVAVSSGSKTFNLAGFPLANMLVSNPLWRQKLQAYIPTVYLGKPDTLAVEATASAYRDGNSWLEDIQQILQANREYLEREFLLKNPDLRWSVMQGTYLAFVDFGARISADKMRTFMLEGCKIAPSFGLDFGQDYGTWVRLNLATSPEVLQQAVERLQMGWDFLKLAL